MGLQVNKKEGEMALRLLRDIGLLERKLRIQSSGNRLVIPLSRRPLPTQQKALSEKLHDFSLSESDFQSRPTSRQTLAEELAGKLPEGLLEILPESLDIIGDIVVVESPEEFKDHEKTLAAGILTVNRNARVVLAKTGAVSGRERIRPVRFLAGEERTTSIHRESGCRFKVDLAKAYFSPRLSHEHQRIVKLVESGERIVDMFAGVGPFSIMIAKKLSDVEVDAIDVNLEAVKLMKENIELNKPRGVLRVWHGDAKDVVRKHLSGIATRVIMNHPSDSTEFIPAACGALVPEGGIVHYYAFAEGPDCEVTAINELVQGLANCGWKLEQLLGTRKVREVAPMRWQVVVDVKIALEGTHESRC
ncbi:hypothetical protein AUG19_05195 [archaeon 13_1_20CM_2_54_9]|nr:MAG: hypothetical protein AUJ07_11680 [Crenarchaeota archaeon 13_1_40CM_3_53_5]OLE75592.1 MAG: hypothetical protein AUG19_05195 [archaeon 13_1_20CM_2_54_9]